MVLGTGTEVDGLQRELQYLEIGIVDHVQPSDFLRAPGEGDRSNDRPGRFVDDDRARTLRGRHLVGAGIALASEK